MASGYMIGLYNTTIPFLHRLSASPKAELLMKRLEIEIKNHHPNWTREEVFYKGAETYDAFMEAIVFLPSVLTDEEQHNIVKEIVETTGQHYSLVLLSHALGNLIETNVKTTNNQIEDH